MRNEAVPSSLNPKPSSLTDAVRFWGNWVLEQAQKELSPFYPSVVPHPSPLNPHPSPETPIAYIWSRTIRCPNPSCGAEIPLFRQFWLARKGARKEIALAPVVDRDRRCVNFRIVQRQGDSWQVIDDSPSNPRPSPLIPNSFDPSKGTVSRGNAVCLVCGTSVKDDYVKAEAQAGRMGHRPRRRRDNKRQRARAQLSAGNRRGHGGFPQSRKGTAKPLANSIPLGFRAKLGA
jgi:hypothetical protein